MLRDVKDRLRRAIREEYPPPLLAVIVIVLGVLIASFLLPTKRLTIPEQVAEIVKGGSIARCAKVRGAVVNGIDYEAVCRNNIAYQLAFRTLDVSYCERLDGVLVPREICQRLVLAEKIRAGGDLGECNAFSVREGARMDCEAAYWKREAVSQNNVELCDNITGEKQSGARYVCKDNFLLERFIAEPETTSCGAVSSILSQNGCDAYKEAIRARDRGICPRISEERVRSVCFRKTSRNSL